MNQSNQTYQTTMTIKRFSDLVEAYGANAKRWPIDERADALKLLDESVEARRLQQSALTLDTLLDRVPIAPASAALKKRIIAQAHRVTSQSQDAWQWLIQWLIGTTPREHFLRPAFALMVPLLLGISIGLNLNAVSEDENLLFQEEVSLLALGPME
ncbi:MAG: hypothetical protein DRR00_15375 [Candidatus Parabeggiatoa sp. nov. 3]|nr:MAG: hypothetical protein DRR00_15375 [Gammaproteobacteria bacterium]